MTYSFSLTILIFLYIFQFKFKAEDAVCLADFCDIMRCEVFETEDASSLKFGDQHIVTDIEVWGDSLGQNSALAKANAAYLSLIPRQVLVLSCNYL